MSSSFPLVQFVVSTGARTLGLKPFVELTVDQLLFGYDDTLVRLAHNFFPKHLRPKAQMGLLLGVSLAAHYFSVIAAQDVDQRWVSQFACFQLIQRGEYPARGVFPHQILFSRFDRAIN